jgi:hypothetical protein
MRRVRKSLIWPLGGVAALAVMAALWGCNGTDVDDPSVSDSLLVVDAVEPASIQADVSPNTDPNGVLPPSPPADDTVTVTVRNLNRTQSSSGIFGDIQISSFDLNCTDGTLAGLVNSTGNPASLTIPADSSAAVAAGLFTGAFKQANSGSLLGITSGCSLTFHGQDLSGEPILSQEAHFTVSFVDTP